MVGFCLTCDTRPYSARVRDDGQVSAQLRPVVKSLNRTLKRCFLGWLLTFERQSWSSRYQPKDGRLQRVAGTGVAVNAVVPRPKRCKF